MIVTQMIVAQMIVAQMIARVTHLITLKIRETVYRKEYDFRARSRHEML